MDSQSQVKHLILVPGRAHRHHCHPPCGHLSVPGAPQVMATYTPAASFPTLLGWAATSPLSSNLGVVETEPRLEADGPDSGTSNARQARSRGEWATVVAEGLTLRGI